MSYTFLKVKKIKSRVSVLHALKHDSREHIPINADVEKTDENFSSDNVQNAMQKYSEMLPEKVRKNAVHAIEVVCSSAGFTGDWNSYLADCKKWTDKTFGGSQNCLHWSIHRDETSPHLHAVYIPLVEKKLNANKFLGGTKERLSDLQTDFYVSVGKARGLQRGEHGKKYNNRTSLKSEFSNTAVLQKMYKSYIDEFKKIAAVAPKELPEFDVPEIPKKDIWRQYTKKSTGENCTYEQMLGDRIFTAVKKYAAQLCRDNDELSKLAAYQKRQIADITKLLDEKTEKLKNTVKEINEMTPETLRQKADMREKKQKQQETKKPTLDGFSR